MSVINTSIFETTFFQSEIKAVLRGKLQKEKLLNVAFKAIPIIKVIAVGLTICLDHHVTGTDFSAPVS